MRTRSLLAAAGAALALAVTPLGSASAAPAFDPASPKAANPAQTCAFVASYAKAFQVDLPAELRGSACVRMIAAKAPVVPAGDPTAQCAAYEQAGFISYPYAFYADAPMGFPGLIAYDRTQCGRALWAFHTLGGLAGDE